MIIYKTTCLINNKLYIGQTNGNRRNYLGSGKLLMRAIKKHGKNNFIREDIVFGDFNQALTDELERHYVQLYNTTNLNIGYNVEKGGLRGKERGVKTNKGHKHTKEYCEAIRQRQLGRKLTEGTKDKLSEALIGKSKSKIHSENIGKAKRKPVLQFTKQGELIKEWISITEAEKVLNINASNISACCKGAKRKPGGFIWKYL